VTLNHCHSVSNDGIESLLEGCCFIRMLELIGCDLISNGSVDAMANYGTNLTSLNLFACGLVDTGDMHTLGRLANCRPLLQYVNLVGTSVSLNPVRWLLDELKRKEPNDKRPLELCLEFTRFWDVEWFSPPDFVKVSFHPFQLRDYPRDNAIRP
jgi:hypothetical protein